MSEPGDSDPFDVAQLSYDLAVLLRRARRVLVLDARSSVLAEVTDPGALVALAATLRLKPGGVAMTWMGWPDVSLAFRTAQDRRLVTLGFLLPDWMEWQPYGHRELAAPQELAEWLASVGAGGVSG